MGPSKVSDECSSSESGWTTYLASPIHDDKDYENEDDENEDEHISTHHQVNIYENEEKSDDSMASDASSGPSHLEVSNDRSKTSHLFGKHQSKLFSCEKNSKQVKKGGKIEAGKEATRGNANAPTCYSKTAEKVRKTKKTGKK